MAQEDVRQSSNGSQRLKVELDRVGTKVNSDKFVAMMNYGVLIRN